MATGHATSTSNLDIVVVLEGPPAPYRETIRVEGTAVELFVHTATSLTRWFDQEGREGRCTLAHMLATGIRIAGPDTEEIQTRARSHLGEGPVPWSDDTESNVGFFDERGSITRSPTGAMRSLTLSTTLREQSTRTSVTPSPDRCSP